MAEQLAKFLETARRLPAGCGTFTFGPAFPLVSRYFFSVYNEGSRLDTAGEELPNNEAAWRQATIIAGELLRNMDGKFQPGQEWRLEVTDERRNPLYILRVYGEEI